MKRFLILALMIGAALLAACSNQGEERYAVIAPLSPTFERVEVRIAEPSTNSPVLLELIFSAKDEATLTVRVNGQNGVLTLVDALPLAGYAAGAELTPEALRDILVSGGIVSGAQFKVTDSGRLLGVLQQLAEPGMSSPVMPSDYLLVENHLSTDQ